MARRELLVLDFDGVICDSVDECFVSSWYAYDLYTGEERTSCALTFRQLFAGYRPFIRRGADYVLLQYCIEHGIPLQNQSDFDAQERSFGPDSMDQFHELFYTARSNLLEHQKRYWISLNRLYPGMREALTDPEENWHILSTKKSSFIIEILEGEGIVWDHDKVHYSAKERKIPFIEDLQKRFGADGSVFIDDQIDHFIGSGDTGITCLLAGWGYVKDAWIDQDEYRVLSLDDLVISLRQRILPP